MPEPVDLDKLSSDELAAILDTTQEDGTVVLPTSEPAPVEAEAPAADEAEPTEPESVAAEPEDQLDPRDQRIRELEQHNSRLAGKAGFLESRLKALSQERGVFADTPTDDEVPEDYTPAIDPMLANEIETLRLQREEDSKRIEQLERDYDSKRLERTMQAEAQRIEETIGGVLPGDDSAIQASLARHADLIGKIKNESDPSLIQSAAKFLAESVGADVLAARNQRMTARRMASTAANHRAKIAATVSGSGGAASPPPRPRSVSDMTAAEADRWLRENVT